MDHVESTLRQAQDAFNSLHGEVTLSPSTNSGHVEQRRLRVLGCYQLEVFMGSAWVYILKCADDSYYTGSTNNLEFRLAEHKAGEGGRYTSGRLPVTLVYLCEFVTEHDAFLRER